MSNSGEQNLSSKVALQSFVITNLEIGRETATNRWIFSGHKIHGLRLGHGWLLVRTSNGWRY